MPKDHLVAQLRSRRSQIQEEMRIRLDELDRLINLVVDSDLPNPITDLNSGQSGNKRRRRRGEEVTLGDIIERPILSALLATDTLTTKQMASLLPGKRIGPLVSAWKRRAVAAGVVFDDLVQRNTSTSGDVAFSLTPEGRRVFGSVAQVEPQPAPKQSVSADAPTAQQPHWPTLTSALES